MGERLLKVNFLNLPPDKPPFLQHLGLLVIYSLSTLLHGKSTLPLRAAYVTLLQTLYNRTGMGLHAFSDMYLVV